MEHFANRIEINPEIMLGKPVIKGTRLTVEQILIDLAAGQTFQELVANHPRLKEQDIKAALRFASSSLKGEKVYPLAL